MASATPTYNFTAEEVSHLANCDTQDDFLFNFQRILQTKSIDVTAVFDTQTTLGSPTDYGASVLTFTQALLYFQVKVSVSRKV